MRVGFSDIAELCKNFSFLSRYLSTEQEERQHQQTGQNDSAISQNPTVMLLKKDVCRDGGDHGHDTLEAFHPH